MELGFTFMVYSSKDIIDRVWRLIIVDTFFGNIFKWDEFNG